MLCVDHGPCVSGAHNSIVNSIVTTRAGKDLVSCLVSGLLTIGPRLGGANDDAAWYFKDAYDRNRDNKDKRVELLQKFVGIGYLNWLFVLARYIGLIAHTFDQKRLKQPLYRHPWEDVLHPK
ncbi:hypothetical protein V8G54_007537 [Vigna mungo]|uniref:Uncharacterized protein n=1 Tax=Vigna mungo TaxID=3915 RepID=A0AAQ3P3H3_VIGMU